MSSASEFFSELERFLPVFVSAIPSYAHATVAFAIVLLVGHIITRSSTHVVIDIDGDDEESEIELKMKKFIYYGITVAIGVFLADLTFGASWMIRNGVNRKHLVYKRWFPKILGTS